MQTVRARSLTSGTILALILIAFILIGVVVAEWPKITGASRLRGAAKQVGAALREAYPDARVYVKANRCACDHAADLTVHLYRETSHVSAREQDEELKAWLKRRFPRVFLRERVVVTRSGVVRGALHHPCR